MTPGVSTTTVPAAKPSGAKQPGGVYDGGMMVIVGTGVELGKGVKVGGMTVCAVAGNSINAIPEISSRMNAKNRRMGVLLVLLYCSQECDSRRILHPKDAENGFVRIVGNAHDQRYFFC